LALECYSSATVGADETSALSVKSRIIRTIGLVLLPSLRDWEQKETFP